MLVVTGGAGFLGSIVVDRALSERRAVAAAVHRAQAGYSVPTEAFDLTQGGAAKKMIAMFKPSVVVNCAALADVDECERSSDRARQLNVELPEMLATECKEAGVGFAHISTDMVFDGERGNYSEADEPRPLNTYARSKLDGERAVASAMPEALILRTNFIGVSPAPGAGLAEWIADKLEAGERIKGFTDVIVSPLFAGDLARLILRMIDRNLGGVYHLVAADSVSKYDLACRIAAALDLDDTLIDRAKVSDVGLTAPRPLDISLDSSRAAAALGEALPSVQDGVDAFAKLRKSRKMRPGAEAKIPT